MVKWFFRWLTLRYVGTREPVWYYLHDKWFPECPWPHSRTADEELSYE